MKNLNMRLLTTDGDELETIPVEAFVIAEAWDEPPPEDTQEDIIARVDSLFTNLLTLLRERQAAPHHGRMRLKLALGEALLSADEFPGDVVIDVTVRPLEENDDGFDETE